MADLKEVKRPFSAPVFCGGALFRFASSNVKVNAVSHRLSESVSTVVVGLLFNNKSPPFTLVLSFQTRQQVQPIYYCMQSATR